MLQFIRKFLFHANFLKISNDHGNVDFAQELSNINIACKTTQNVFTQSNLIKSFFQSIFKTAAHKNSKADHQWLFRLQKWRKRCTNKQKYNFRNPLFFAKKLLLKLVAFRIRNLFDFWLVCHVLYLVHLGIKHEV